MSQEEIRMYWANNKRNNREKQKISQSSQETQLSGKIIFSIFKIGNLYAYS